MSRILFLADLHGNMPATCAMEQYMNEHQVDDVWFLGDAAGKGPEGDQTVDWVRQHCNHHISGNWDLLCVEFARKCPEGFENSAFFWKQLGQERLDWLESLPQEDEILISGIRFRLFHGRPIDKNYHPYLSMDEFRSGFTDSKGNLYGGFISADCHQPYIRELDLGYAINTGSVGNSLGITRCHALIVEGEVGSPEAAPISMNILSIPYDNQLAVRIADECPELPDREAYKKEILTGVYSR